MTNRNRRKDFFYAAIFLGIGLGLICFLGVWDNLNVKDLALAIVRTRPLFGGLIIVSTVFHFWISALKWRLITEQIVDFDTLRTPFLRYTIITGLLAQFLPQQLCVVVVRAVVLRSHDSLRTRYGVASSLFDQVFDFLIPALLVIPGLLVILGYFSTQQFLIISFVMLLCPGIVVALFAGKFIKVSGRVVRLVPGIGRWFSGPAIQGGKRDETLLFSMAIVTRLYVLSIIRYVNLLLRSCLVVGAVGLKVPLTAVVSAFSPVLLSGVISVTPANLGIAEWGWVGLLTISGLASETAAKFALLNRCYVFLAVIAVNMGLAVCLFLRKGRRQKGF